MSAQAAQVSSGMTPARISFPKIQHPMQTAKTDSSVAATTSRATSTPAAVSAPATSASTAAAVVIAAPIPWANRFGGRVGAKIVIPGFELAPEPEPEQESDQE